MECEHTTTALADAICRGDAAAAATLYTDDAKLLVAAADFLAGRVAIEAYWQAGINLGLSRLELKAVDLETVELEVSSAIAIEIGRYTLALELRGAASAFDRGKYLVLHRRLSDGSWRRAVDVFNPDAPRATTNHRR
jgi:ketosteroid isomerase-like protein